MTPAASAPAPTPASAATAPRPLCHGTQSATHDHDARSSRPAMLRRHLSLRPVAAPRQIPMHRPQRSPTSLPVRRSDGCGSHRAQRSASAPVFRARHSPSHAHAATAPPHAASPAHAVAARHPACRDAPSPDARGSSFLFQHRRGRAPDLDAAHAPAIPRAIQAESPP